MKIAFITDGGKEIGMGHVQQSVTLAQELKKKAEIIFLTRSNTAVINHIKKFHFNVIKKTNDIEILNYIKCLSPQWVIIDRIDVEENFAKRIQEEVSARLAIFTNITPANQYADIAVIADYGSYFRNIKFIDDKTRTFYYYGPRYWILRKDFFELKKKARVPADSIERILIIFGGSDPLNLTSAVLDVLLELNDHYLFDVVLGGGFTFMTDLNHVLRKYTNKRKEVNLYQNINNVSKVMFDADLAITSPGLSLFESLCVGTPVIAFHQNSIQKERTAQVYKGFIPTLSISDICMLPDMISKRQFIYPEDTFVQNLEIGQGKEEIIDHILRGLD